MIGAPHPIVSHTTAPRGAQRANAPSVCEQTVALRTVATPAERYEVMPPNPAPLSLPPVPNPNNLDGGTPTLVRWRHAFVGKTVFSEWSRFEQLATEAAGDVPRIAPQHLTTVAQGLSFARSALASHAHHMATENQMRTVNGNAMLAVETVVKAFDDMPPDLRLESEFRVRSEQVTASVESRSVVQNPVQTVPDFGLMRGTEVVPIATVEVKGPRHKLYKPEVDGRSASSLADHYNKLFAGQSTDRNNGGTNVFRIVAQALMEALHTQSGCGALYSHNLGVFFHITAPNTQGKVQVQVSRAYKSDGSVSALTALAGMLRYAVKHRNDFSSVYLSTLAIGGKKSSSGGSASGAGSGHGRGSRSGGRGAGVGKGKRRAERGSSSTGRATGECVAFALHPELDSSSVGSWDSEDELGNNDLVETLLSKHQGVLGQGGTGIVLKGEMDGAPVAMKYWNEEEGYGEELLGNEVRVYEALARKHPAVMGKSIPRLVAIGDLAWEGKVLVTSCVGEDVRSYYTGRGDEREMRFRGKGLCQEQKRGIRDAALRSLDLLHNCGVAHGDVALRNLRVSPVSGSIAGSEGKWVAWWIDLGLSTMGASFEDRAIERKHCEGVFDNDAW